MKNLWILFVFPILCSLGLVMVILGQFQEMDMINKKKEELQKASETFYNKLQYEGNFKKSLYELLVKGEKTIKELEAELTNLTPQLESKRKESITCQEQVKTKSQEVASTEEEQRKTTDTVNAESEAWKKEIVTLKASLEGYRPICDYVNDKKALELCGKVNQTVEEKS